MKVEASANLRRIDDDAHLQLEAGEVRVTVNLDCGAHIFELVDLRSGTNLLYQDPQGSRNYRVGGWYELFPNAGAACDVDGRRYSRHGDVQHARWELDSLRVEEDHVVARVSTRSREAPARLTRTMSLFVDGNFRLEESIANESDHDIAYLWGHHITFGEPMMSRGARIRVPAVEFRADLTQHVDSPYPPGARGPLNDFPAKSGARIDLGRFDHPPHSRMLFADLDDDAWFSLESPTLALRAEVDWDVITFPSLWLWATTRGTAEDPELVACALEPQVSSVPSLSGARESGTSARLSAREERHTWLQVKLVHTNENRRTQIRRTRDETRSVG